MKVTYRWSLAAATLMAVSAGYLMLPHSASATATQKDATQVVSVSVEFLKNRSLPELITGFADVLPGTSTSLSFPQPGQLARLTVRTGDRVTKGQPLAVLQLDPSANESYLQAKVALDLAKKDVERIKSLLGLQLATQAQLDLAQKSELDATTLLNTLAAKGAGETQSLIVAPFNGVVSALPAIQGDRLAAGSTVVQIANTDALRVQVGISPIDIERIKPGSPVTLVPLTTTTGSNGQAIQSTVTSTQNIVDPKTQQVSAVADLSGPASTRLALGMKLKASITVGTVQGLTVPRNAVLTDAKGAYVFQVLSSKAKRIDVEKVYESQDWVAISGPLKTDLPVVTVGNYELSDGMTVRFTSSQKEAL